MRIGQKYEAGFDMAEILRVDFPAFLFVMY